MLAGLVSVSFHGGFDYAFVSFGFRRGLLHHHRLGRERDRDDDHRDQCSGDG
jgi:hypothetical protein